MKPETVAFLRKRRLWIACWALGILAVALVAAKLAFFPSPDVPDDPRVMQARQDLRALAGALGIYLIDHGRYPTQQEGLAILLREGIIHEIPKDVFELLDARLDSSRKLPSRPGVALHFIGR